MRVQRDLTPEEAEELRRRRTEYTPWIAADESKLRCLVTAGKTIAECAREMGVGYNRIVNKLRTREFEDLYKARRPKPKPPETITDEPGISDNLENADAKWAQAFATASASFTSVTTSRSWAYEEPLEGGPSL